MTRTIIIRRDYLHYIPKYSAFKLSLFRMLVLNVLCLDRYEKRHRNLAVHLSPAFRVQLGDMVTVGTPSLSTSTGNECLIPASQRSMPTTLQDRSIQRAASDAVEGCDEGILQVLTGFYWVW